ncbi:MAG: alpha/beta hydrolase family protein [Sporichthyaceae bacterium]
MDAQLEVETPVGPARIERSAVAGSRRGRGVLVLGHGAGGGVEARDLVALAEALPNDGVTVLRVTQPWRLAGRKVAAAPRTLDVAWTAALAAARDAGWIDGPLVVGGRSAGARVACRTALATGAVGALALAFPLHPPGRPEKSRAGELADSGVPTLVVQGERDPFGGPAEFPAGTLLAPVPFADHGFKVPARAPIGQAEALDLLVVGVRTWWAQAVGE